MENGADYRGNKEYSAAGTTCEKWTTLDSVQRISTDTYSTLGEHNHCRNPDESPKAWCHTAHNRYEWKYCSIGQPKISCTGMFMPNLSCLRLIIDTFSKSHAAHKHLAYWSHVSHVTSYFRRLRCCVRFALGVAVIFLFFYLLLLLLS